MTNDSPTVKLLTEEPIRHIGILEAIGGVTVAVLAARALLALVLPDDDDEYYYWDW